ncbi:MAG: D-aminoacyl-tRNA deacylase [Ferroplasma sp.]|uniref:D-aminoacyl-tRNA deacylase n=1 Tax=Ferroplasma sp. TaxID=2591003 RepID=UPI002814B11B|nr:D-aminoacyl-tRNA deacylase [Ferroplasma sp.]WMT51449.1 MAG: D-aminoacyl-tRNA deacylase [Ferroplasma sp.]
MILIIASRKDGASMEMADKMIRLYNFRQENTDTFTYRNYKLLFIGNLHIYNNVENLDDSIEKVVFLSKHSSSAGVKSLTVHPVGNLRKAELGGFDNVIVPSDPEGMGASLRYIKSNYHGNYFEITFEATHHGPYLEKPSYFIEIGTTENEWKMDGIAELMARSVIDGEIIKYKNYVGVGGGHYAPKLSSYFFENEINIGHIIPKYIHETISIEEIESTVKKTPECRGFLMDAHGTKGRVKDMIGKIADEMNLEIIKI